MENGGGDAMNVRNFRIENGNMEITTFEELEPTVEISIDYCDDYAGMSKDQAVVICRALIDAFGFTDEDLRPGAEEDHET
jgi:hypothetical protein